MSCTSVSMHVPVCLFVCLSVCLSDCRVVSFGAYAAWSLTAWRCTLAQYGVIFPSSKPIFSMVGGLLVRERDQRTPSVERPCWSPAFTAFRTVLACLENRLGVVHILLCSLEMLKKNRPSLQVSCRLLVAESLLEAVDSFGMAAVDLS